MVSVKEKQAVFWEQLRKGAKSLENAARAAKQAKNQLTILYKT
jgi:hypothetical protein